MLKDASFVTEVFYGDEEDVRRLILKYEDDVIWFYDPDNEQEIFSGDWVGNFRGLFLEMVKALPTRLDE